MLAKSVTVTVECNLSSRHENPQRPNSWGPSTCPRKRIRSRKDYAVRNHIPFTCPYGPKGWQTCGNITVSNLLVRQKAIVPGAILNLLQLGNATAFGHSAKFSRLRLCSPWSQRGFGLAGGSKRDQVNQNFNHTKFQLSGGEKKIQSGSKEGKEPSWPVVSLLALPCIQRVGHPCHPPTSRRLTKREQFNIGFAGKHCSKIPQTRDKGPGSLSFSTVPETGMAPTACPDPAAAK